MGIGKRGVIRKRRSTIRSVDISAIISKHFLYLRGASVCREELTEKISSGQRALGGLGKRGANLARVGVCEAGSTSNGTWGEWLPPAPHERNSRRDANPQPIGAQAHL